MKLFDTARNEMDDIRNGNVITIGAALDCLVPGGSLEEDRRDVVESIKGLLDSWIDLEVQQNKLEYVFGVATGVIITGAVTLIAAAVVAWLIPMLIT